MHEKLDKAKIVIKNNWKPFAIGVGLTVVTLIVTRRLITYPVLIGAGKTVRISKTAVNTGAFYKVFNIYSPGVKHLGPSWMVRCTETGKNFRSITYASKEMGISTSMLSTHLQGKASSAGGYTFTKLGVAV